ncbi:MAG: hypothetical protein Q4B01_09460, partial [Eubacteriales bacterium]|nr:hypothetical protein [Eubacteriales bacterium]
MNKRSVSHVPSRLAGLLFSVFLLMSLCSSVSAQEISCTDPNWIIISKTDALIESQTFEENVFIEPKAGLALGNSLSDDETTYLFKKNVYAAGGLMSYGAKAHIAGTLYTDMIFPSFDSIADGTFEDKMVLADDYTEADLERGIGFIWVSDNITYSDIVLKHSAVSMTVSHNLGPVTTNSDGEKEAVCSKCGNVVTVELASDSDSTAAMAKSAVPKKLNKTPDKTDSGSTPGKTDSGTTTPGKTDSG